MPKKILQFPLLAIDTNDTDVREIVNNMDQLAKIVTKDWGYDSFDNAVEHLDVELYPITSTGDNLVLQERLDDLKVEASYQIIIE